MSQVTQPRSHLRQSPSRRAVLLGALVAAVAAVVLAFALAAGSSDDPRSVSEQSAPTVRADGGPDESVVAAAAWSRRAPSPHESRSASAIRTADAFSSRPDEGRIAASIASR
jgi:hypothetical protein